MFLSPIFAQEIRLNLNATHPDEDTKLDSLKVSDSYSNFSLLKKTIDSLPIQLQKIGYLDAEIKYFEKANDSAYTASIYFGKQWKNLIISYSKNDFSEREFFQLGYRPQDDKLSIPFNQLEHFMESLSKLKSNKGYPFAGIQLTEIQKISDGSVTVNLILNNRESRIINDWIVKGYEKFPKSFIRYYAGVKRGKPFRKQKLAIQNERLDQLGFVRSIKPPEALFKPDSTIVYFYLEKTNQNLFDGILGFATDENTQRLALNGYLSLDLNNNLNFGEQLKIEYKADGGEQQNFLAFAKLPYLLGSPVGLSAELKIFKRDSTFSTTEQQLRLIYQASPAIQIYSGYKHYESSNLLEEIQAGNTVEDFNSNYAIAGASLSRSQNNSLFPIKQYFGLDLEIGKRKQVNNQVSQVRIAAKANHIFELNLNNSIYIGNISSYLSSETYLTNELFRFGGINTLRGFNENSLDATLYSLFNTEYRYQFNNSLYLHSILDFAYLENKISKIEEQLYGIGIGFGIKTKSGILHLALANGFSKNQDPDLANTKVHLRFSTTF